MFLSWMWAQKIRLLPRAGPVCWFVFQVLSVSLRLKLFTCYMLYRPQVTTVTGGYFYRLRIRVTRSRQLLETLAASNILRCLTFSASFNFRQ